MKSIKTHCIVLKSKVIREMDKLVTLISPDIGIFNVVAFGACRSQKKYGGKLEMFSVLDVVLETKMVGNELEYRFKELILIDSFPNLSLSLDYLLTGQFFCEVLLKNNTSGEERRLFALLFQGLKALNFVEKEKIQLVFINYLIRYLAYVGFFSPYEECSLCGHKWNQHETIYIKREDFQPYCYSCAERDDVIPIEEEIWLYISKILKLNFQNSLQISINKNGGRKLKTFLISQLEDISGFKYKTLENFS